MLSEREVINTLNMLRNEHLDVRTVTLGVSLFDCVSHDIDLFTGNVKAKLHRYASQLVNVCNEVGDKYGIPTYGMYNLATGFTPAYDQSYTFTCDPDLVAQGWNTNFLLDEELDQLTMDMVYGVDPSDTDTYLDLWQKFIIRWNQLLPEVPLYSNVYYTVYPDWLQGYEQSSMWEFNQAILYASVANAE